MSGTPGARGSLWFSGNGPPGNISGQRANDMYIDGATGDLYQRGAGAWIKGGNIRGPQGPQGAPGPAGPPGGSPPPIQPPPPTSGIPAIPTSVPGWKITNTTNFAGLTTFPSTWWKWGPSQPGGDPVAWWVPANVILNPNYLSLVTTGPMTLPDGQTGYTSAGIGCSYSQVNGRTDVCIRFPTTGAGMSYIALLWPDSGSWPTSGEDDFVETGGGSIYGGFNATSHWGAANNNPQVHTPAFASFDWTAFHVWSVEALTGLRIFLVDGTEWGRITNSNLPDTAKNLDFQAQWLGNGTPTPPCPMDIAWAQQYQPA